MPHSRLLRRAAIVAAAVAVSAVAASPANAAQNRDRDRDRDDAQMFYATTSQNLLLQFDERRPDRLIDAQSIIGLGDATLVGIDFRPKTGDLYGVGSNSAVYRINPFTGIAIAENRDATGAPIPFTPALRGTKFGIDFNPVPDAIRVVSDQRQNLRLSPDAGTVAGTDADLNPGQPMVVGAAYTNSSFSFTPPASTTLYVLDAASDQVFVQNPPNAGTLTNGQPLGLNLGLDVGWDIVGDDNKGYLANRRPGARGSTLYRVNPATGRTKSLGKISNGRRVITGLAGWQSQG
jgi:Domain of unknown function (DUF4394)